MALAWTDVGVATIARTIAIRAAQDERWRKMGWLIARQEFGPSFGAGER
jgi:hypothetical protein